MRNSCQRRSVVCALLSFLCLTLFGWAARARNVGDVPMKVGFIMGGPVSDFGWNQAHNEGRLYLEKTMKGKVETFFAEKIPENAEAARIMERMIAQGAKVIFLTTYGYLDPAIGVATRHPDVVFMQINRLSSKPVKNIGSYFPHFYEPMYVAGIVAGRMTKRNRIGFIVGHPVPNVCVTVNAFTLGARSVNPEVRVNVVCTNSWSDPVAEAEATRGLVERGCDIMASHLDSALPVCISADRAGVYSVGEHIDLNAKVPKSWLTGQRWNYGALYVKLVRAIMEGSWKPDAQYYGLKDDCIRLSSFGQSVPSSVKIEATKALKDISEGRLIVFRGPLTDNRGVQRLGAGSVLSNSDLASTDWTVEGVECSFGKK